MNIREGVESPSDKRSRTEELMLKRLLVIAVLAVFAGGIGYADQSRTKVVIPVNKTAPTSGKQMYDVDPIVWTAFRSPISGNAARSRRGGGNVEIVF
jgi:hypothetical protein